MACIDENVTVVGLFSPEILMFDKRADSAPVQTHRIHKASVLDIRLNQFRGNTLYSASEDRTVATFDLKAGEISCRKKLHAADEKAYALCLAINDDICPYALYAGDTLGNVHLLDGRTLKRLSTNELCVPEMVGSRKVRDMAMAPGTLVATFESGDIRIMNPTCPPNFVTSVKATTSNITRVSTRAIL